MALQDFPIGLVVVDNQRALARQIHLVRDHSERRRLQGQLHGEPKRRTFADLTLDANRAAHQLDQLPRDREPQTGAPKLAGDAAVGLREGLKQAFSRLRRDADPRVGDGEAQSHALALFAFPGDPHDHLAALGEFDGIAHQIEQHLLQAAGVADDLNGDAVVDEVGQLQTLGMRPFRHHLQAMLHRIAQFEGPQLKGQHASFDLGEIQDVIDDGQEAIGARPDRVGKAALFRCEFGVE